MGYPDIVAALTWRGIYDPIFGGLNQLLIKLGLIDKGIAWLGDFDLALPSVIAVNVWKGVPFFTIVLLAGLKALDSELSTPPRSTAPGPGVASSTSSFPACAT